LVVLQRKRDKKDKPDEETHALATHLSKSKRKKLDQIADRKVCRRRCVYSAASQNAIIDTVEHMVLLAYCTQAKAEKRGDLYKRLEGQQLTAQQLGLMQHSGHLGKKDTLKEVLLLMQSHCLREAFTYCVLQDGAAIYAGIQLSTNAVGVF
jgi:hypothetical protein